MAADKIRWGILGCGTIAAKFADALSHVDDARLLAAGSRSGKNANLFADAHGIPRRYDSYEKLAGDKDLDIIYIATPHNLHAENTILCLNAGKHVLCEKPLAVNARQAKEMIDCARSNNRFLMEAMWTRFMPLLDKLRHLLTDNAIGRVRMLTADFGFRPDPRKVNQRLLDPALAGGALLDVGVYPLSLSSMIFGKPSRIQSSAVIGPTGVDEQNAVILDFDTGGQAVLSSAVQLETPQEAVLAGTEGMVRLHRSWWRGSKLSLVQPERTEQFFELPTYENGFIYEIRAVHNDLRHNRLENMIMPLDESFSILQTMDAIRGQWGLLYPFEKKQPHKSI